MDDDHILYEMYTIWRKQLIQIMSLTKESINISKRHAGINIKEFTEDNLI